MVMPPAIFVHNTALHTENQETGKTMITTCKRKKLTAAAVLLGLSCSASTGFASTSEMEMINELKKIIQQQQEQLNKQAQQIDNLQRRIDGGAVATDHKAEMKEEDTALSSIIKSSYDNVDVRIYGQVNRAVLVADDGDSTETYFVDNSHSSTRMGLDGKVTVNEGFSVGTKIEYEFRSNPSGSVNQLSTSTDDEISLRHADLFFHSSRLGKISLGQGSMAADGTSTLDLSGTNVVNSVTVSDMAGSVLWHDGTALTDIKIKDVYSDLDGGRKDRVRYDTPSFAGFTASTSVADDDQYDFAVRYSRKYDGATVAAAIAWQNPGSDDIDNIYNGSLAVLLNSGLNFQFSAGTEDGDETNEGSFWYAKLGYRAKLTSLGTTSFSVDYGMFDDFMTDGGEAEAFAFGVVQDIPSWGTELYLAYRQYMYDESTLDVEDINVFMAGTRVKF